VTALIGAKIASTAAQVDANAARRRFAGHSDTPCVRNIGPLPRSLDKPTFIK